MCIWQTLPSLQTGDRATTLVRHSFHDGGYTVQVTDMSCVWCESLNKEETIARAETLESSIDPSEDDDQYWILLRKIEGAIRGDNGTEISISGRDGRNDSLLLKVNIPLPQPLTPLKWELNLAPMRGNAIRSELFTPLLSWTYIQHQQIGELARLLAEKDNVITKVLDKVESLGMDLESIFPIAGHSKLGRRVKRREVIAEHVRGLASFSFQQWKDNFHIDNEDALSYEQLVNDAFRGSDSANLTSLGALMSRNILEGPSIGRSSAILDQTLREQPGGFQVNQFDGTTLS